jgi:hypothetical protein
MTGVQVTGNTDKALTWEVAHFSTYVVTQDESGAFATSDRGTIAAADLDTLLTALNGKSEKYEIILNPNAANTLAAANYTITADITIKNGSIDAPWPAAKKPSV